MSSCGYPPRPAPAPCGVQRGASLQLSSHGSPATAGCLPRPLGLTLASSHSTCPSRTSPHPALPPTTHKGAFPALPPVPPASCRRTSACRQCCEPGRTLLAGHRWQGLPWNQLPGLRALVTLRQQRQHPPVRRPDKQPARKLAVKKHPSPVDSAENNVLPQRKAKPRCHCLPQHLPLRDLLRSTLGGGSSCWHPHCGQRQGAVLRMDCRAAWEGAGRFCASRSV